MFSAAQRMSLLEHMYNHAPTGIAIFFEGRKMSVRQSRPLSHGRIQAGGIAENPILSLVV
ncbi:UNVERIFIED_CONTAM: hypothetical protein ABIC26_001099 [Paenibacillus sp. PvR008]